MTRLQLVATMLLALLGGYGFTLAAQTSGGFTVGGRILVTVGHVDKITLGDELGSDSLLCWKGSCRRLAEIWPPTPDPLWWTTNTVPLIQPAKIPEPKGLDPRCKLREDGVSLDCPADRERK